MQQRSNSQGGDYRAPSLPSNLPGVNNKPPEEYEFNSIGFYGGLLSRLDETIRSTEELYKQSFYKVTSYRQQEGLNHQMRSDFKPFNDADLAGANVQAFN